MAIAVDFNYTVKCVVCGKVFKTNRPNQKYCSRKCCVLCSCEIVKKRVTERIEKIQRICKYCGKEFTPKSLKSYYCSQRCSVQYNIKVKVARKQELLKLHRENMKKESNSGNK
jgi:hypothetical protein